MNLENDALAESQFLSIGRLNEHPDTIIIGNGLVTIDLKTGKHTFREGADIDEAARTFWEAVSQMFLSSHRIY